MDTIPGLKNAAGTTDNSGNDTIYGFVDVANASATTLTAGDNLDGGLNSDTLALSITGTAAASSITGVTLKNIEKIQVQNTSSAARTLDLVNSSAYSTLSSNGSSADVTFNNVKVAAAVEMANGSANVSLTNVASALTSGTADSVTLNVNNQSGGTFSSGAGFETVAISSKGSANTVTLAASEGHTKVTVSGDQKITLNVNDAGNTITTIDASAATGAVVLTGVGTAVTSIAGGSGDDSVTIAAATVAAAVTIDGGAGNDTLTLDGAVTKAAAAKVANFEAVSFANAALGGTLSQDASAFATSTLSFAGLNNQNVTVTNLGATQGVAITAATTGTVSTDLLTNTTADTTSVTLGTATAAAGSVTAVTVANAETVNLTSQGGANTIGTLTASSATKLNINAAKALTITTLTAAALKNVDASASAAAVTFTAGQAMTVVGGAGNDALTGSSGADNINAGNGNNTIIGGGGNDTLTGGTGNDSIRGGAANDTIVTGDGTNTVDLSTAAGGSDKVTGGAGSDTVKITFAGLATNGATTIDGGAGTDTIEFTDNNTMNFGTDPTTLNNVSNVEQFKFSGISSKTVTITDATMTATAGTVTLVDTADNASNIFDASGVFGSSAKITLDASALVTNGVEYKASNGADKFTGGAAADTFTVTNNAFLSGSDTVAGGNGSDTLKFTSTTGSTITAAQLANVSSVETLNVTTGGAGNYVFALTDAIISPNATSVGGFSVTRTAGDTGTLKVDASAVSSTYSLTLSGSGGADTLIGGSGNDTITGGNGADSLTGGGGNDTFSYTGAETGGPDTITDINFGTSTTAVDVIAVASGGATWKANAVTKASAGALVDARIAVLDTTTYASLSAMNTAVTTGGAQVFANTNAAVILWQDTLGNVHLTYDSNGATTGGQNDLAVFSGVTITGIASLISTGDFSLT